MIDHFSYFNVVHDYSKKEKENGILFVEERRCLRCPFFPFFFFLAGSFIFSILAVNDKARRFEKYLDCR